MIFLSLDLLFWESFHKGRPRKINLSSSVFSNRSCHIYFLEVHVFQHSDPLPSFRNFLSKSFKSRNKFHRWMFEDEGSTLGRPVHFFHKGRPLVDPSRKYQKSQALKLFLEGMACDRKFPPAPIKRKYTKLLIKYYIIMHLERSRGSLGLFRIFHLRPLACILTRKSTFSILPS